MTTDSRHIVLVGMMGAGKTTVGRRVAERLGRRMVDFDELIEARTGRTVRQIFEADGEPAFRVLETAALVEALDEVEPLVIAAAGGVLMRPENREALRASGAHVVWLRADPAVLAERATRGAHRPLLDGDPDAAMRRLLPARAEPLYREAADAVIDTDRLEPSVVADRVTELARGIRRITVPLGDRSYDVVIGHGAVGALRGLLPSTARRAALVSQATIPFAVDVPIAVSRLEIGDGEPAKTLSTIEMLTRGFAQLGLTRNDVVIGVGGGMVTDVAGFAAATWHRGVPVVHVATTLLGMVDAAIGGKTGVNLPEGKNLVGAFWQPSGVVCDLDALATLPARERRSGDGEMAKYHFLTGDDLDAMTLTDRVARCVEIKADVVASDEREGGRRALLNYGHTLAHALEIATEHRLTHGEAVGVGLIYAAELARLLGRVDTTRVEEHRAVVGDLYGLPTAVPDWLSTDDLVALMGRDKKALTGGLTFVLDGADGVEVVADVPEAAARAALEAVPRMMPAIATERLLLRPFHDDDRPAWAAMHADPLVMATLGPVLDRTQSDALLDRFVARHAELGYGWCSVDLDGACIGGVAVSTPTWTAPFMDPDRPTIEIGWRIASPHWGRGYAPEAARAAVAYGFDELGAPELVAFTAVGNTSSRRVMDKLGMVHDPSGDFDHPNLVEGDPLRRHVLYRLESRSSR